MNSNKSTVLEIGNLNENKFKINMKTDDHIDSINDRKEREKKLNGYCPQIMFQIGHCHQSLKQLPAAIDSFKTLQGVLPSDSSLLVELANLYKDCRSRAEIDIDSDSKSNSNHINYDTLIYTNLSSPTPHTNP